MLEIMKRMINTIAKNIIVACIKIYLLKIENLITLNNLYYIIQSLALPKNLGPSWTPDKL